LLRVALRRLAINITDHPVGEPVFFGAQIQP